MRIHGRFRVPLGLLLFYKQSRNPPTVTAHGVLCWKLHGKTKLPNIKEFSMVGQCIRSRKNHPATPCTLHSVYSVHVKPHLAQHVPGSMDESASTGNILDLYWIYYSKAELNLSSIAPETDKWSDILSK